MADFCAGLGVGQNANFGSDDHVEPNFGNYNGIHEGDRGDINDSDCVGIHDRNDDNDHGIETHDSNCNVEGAGTCDSNGLRSFTMEDIDNDNFDNLGTHDSNCNIDNVERVVSLVPLEHPIINHKFESDDCCSGVDLGPHFDHEHDEHHDDDCHDNAMHHIHDHLDDDHHDDDYHDDDRHDDNLFPLSATDPHNDEDDHEVDLVVKFDTMLELAGGGKMDHPSECSVWGVLNPFHNDEIVLEFRCSREVYQFVWRLGAGVGTCFDDIRDQTGFDTSGCGDLFVSEFLQHFVVSLCSNPTYLEILRATSRAGGLTKMLATTMCCGIKPISDELKGLSREVPMDLRMQLYHGRIANLAMMFMQIACQSGGQAVVSDS